MKLTPHPVYIVHVLTGPYYYNVVVPMSVLVRCKFFHRRRRPGGAGPWPAGHGRRRITDGIGMFEFTAWTEVLTVSSGSQLHAMALPVSARKEKKIII